MHTTTTRTWAAVALAALLAPALAACGGSGDPVADAAGTSTTTAAPTSDHEHAEGDGLHDHEEGDDPDGEVAGEGVDLTALPLGDGAVSDGPAAGSVWACTSTFGGGGAQADGDWIDEATGTFDLTAKATVDGAVSWTSILDVAIEGAARRIEGNGLPDHLTGTFPVEAGTEAYEVDRNPNAIAAQDLDLSVPSDPEVADEPSCLPMGAIGVLTTGSVVFNALDARGEDAVAHEVQDACQGHPEREGTYHYHSLTSCLDDPADGTHSELVGWALDGFGIYGRYGTDGEVLTDDDLDACHGHTHELTVDGVTEDVYHYHATWEYPYTLGCFTGTPSTG